ncbi:hypothetical protein [Photorhabdus sp. SF281]|uniref:hypothetical protein n=1 Tax=Photorhabdus sp. SF281 TaxID=3459527 RepID=UPI004044DC70
MSTENMNITDQTVGKDAVVVGNAEAPAIHSIAIGASPLNSKSISESAIAIGQNQQAGRKEETGDYKVIWPIAIGADSVSSGLASIAIGQKVVASAIQAVAISQNSSATGNASIALGANSISSGSASIALGQKVNASGYQGVAIGQNSSSSGSSSIAIGQNVIVSGSQGITIGQNSSSRSSSSIAIGQKVNINASQGIAIGQNASVTGSGSIALGANSVANKPNIVSVGKPNNQRKIVNVAAGDISNNSAEAVNGQQLYSESVKISALDKKNKQLETDIKTLKSTIDNLIHSITNLTLLSQKNADEIALLKK